MAMVARLPATLRANVDYFSGQEITGAVRAVPLSTREATAAVMKDSDRRLPLRPADFPHSTSSLVAQLKSGAKEVVRDDKGYPLIKEATLCSPKYKTPKRGRPEAKTSRHGKSMAPKGRLLSPVPKIKHQESEAPEGKMFSTPDKPHRHHGTTTPGRVSRPEETSSPESVRRVSPVTSPSSSIAVSPPMTPVTPAYIKKEIADALRVQQTQQAQEVYVTKKV